MQDRDVEFADRTEMEVVTQRQPTDAEWRDLMFAWQICKHVRSNAIVLAKDEATAGIGAGQMSRVDSVRLAIDKSRLETLAGSVCASDAFFPFSDGPGDRDRGGRDGDHPAGRLAARPRGRRGRRRRRRSRWSSRAAGTSVTSPCRPTHAAHCAARARRNRPLSRLALTVLRAWQEHALERMAGWNAGSFLLSAAPGRGQDDSQPRVRAPAARRRRRHARARRLPDDAADAAVGRGRRAPRDPARARQRGAAAAARLPRHRGDVCPRRLVGRPLGAAVRRAHARDRRRGASPRRGARLGRGLRPGLRGDDALAAAVRHAVSLRRQRDRRRALRRRRRRAGRQLHVRRRGRARASAARSSSSRTTGRCRGNPATTSSSRRSATAS